MGPPLDPRHYQSSCDHRLSQSNTLGNSYQYNATVELPCHYVIKVPVIRVLSVCCLNTSLLFGRRRNMTSDKTEVGL